jgi:hypothetical protein
MTLTASGLFYLTFRDIFGNDTAVDVLADSLKVALFTNSMTTPNYDTNTAYAAAPWNANEVGTPSGGVALTSPTTTVQSGSVLTFDAADTAWGSQTISNIRGGLLYDDTIASPVAKPGIAGITFGADYSVTSGVFTIQWAVAGIWTLDFP